MRMPRKNQDLVTRTTRMPKDLDQIIKDYSQRNKISENATINIFVREYSKLKGLLVEDIKPTKEITND
jgi:hypothetical protein